MKKINLLLHFTLLACFALFFSCEDKDDTVIENKSELTIVETAQATEPLSSLVAALAKADEKDGTDLIGTLSAAGPFTVFAPTNEAFAALLANLDGFDSLEDFDTDEEKDLLATILTYHVVAGASVLSTDLSDGQMVTTVQGEDLTINLDGGVFIKDAADSGAQVILADVEASNGIVHLIDTVLIPQSVLDAIAAGMEDSKNLVEIVVATETLSILEAAVIKADLAATLSSEGPFTVFAPTDDAFVALLDILGDDYNSLDDFDTEAELALLTDILLYHVIPAKVLAADLAPSQVGTALANNSVEIIASNGTFVIGDASSVDANITATDIEASNGVAHTIDKVLLPQSAIDFVTNMNMMTIVELAVATNDLSVLVDALVQADAGLVDVLNGEGPFTVFAPTNQAFVDLLDALGDDYNSLADFDTADEKALLTNILTYHVVGGAAAFSTDLNDKQSIGTVQGENVIVNLNNGVFIQDATGTDAQVIIADVEASNGVVHVINKVLLPQVAVDFLAMIQMKTIVEIAQETNDLSVLVDALVQADAGLVEALSGEGPFTVFAPTNQSFQDFLDLAGNDYNSLADFDTEAEKELLAKLLLYHVVSGANFKSDLSTVNSVTTLQGESIVVEIRSDGVIVVEDPASNDHTQVVIEDVEARNGVVHVVNKVLIPQEVWDALIK